MQGIAAKSHPDLGLLRECRVRLKHEAVPSRQSPSFACVLLRLLAWVASPACLLKIEDDRSGQGGQNYCCDETSFRKEIGAIRAVLQIHALAEGEGGGVSCSGPAFRWDYGLACRRCASMDVGEVLAVIGPGTGLGVGGVVETRAGWVALPGEGGHATLMAADDHEAAIIAAARQEHGHVSAERLLSGIGLPTLHAAVAKVAGVSAQRSTAEAIIDGAVTGRDALAVQTIDVFCGLLGSFAGNLALTLGARGGVYVGGGIVPRLGNMFFSSRFRERFESKGRFTSYVRAIPTALITDTHAALAGAAFALAQHRG